MTPTAQLNFDVYPAQQLGRALDHYDMARDGIADVTYVSPGYQPGQSTVFDAIDLPFLVYPTPGPVPARSTTGTAIMRRPK